MLFHRSFSLSSHAHQGVRTPQPPQPSPSPSLSSRRHNNTMKIQKIGNPMSRQQSSSSSKICTPTLLKLILLLCIAVMASLVGAIFFLFGQSTVDVPSSSSSDLNVIHVQQSHEKKMGGMRGGAILRRENVENLVVVDSEKEKMMIDLQPHNENGLLPPQQAKQKQQQEMKNFLLVSQKQPQILQLNMPHGSIRINLRPDLSYESVQHINDLLDASSVPCSPCRFYRSEKDLLIQGILKKDDGPPPNTILGPCPPEYQNNEQKQKQRKCPPHDPNCGCHGPIMTRGMVAWAGGGGGPDFFINMYHEPVDWWHTDHTVWGEVVHEESLRIIQDMFEWSTTERNGMTFLDNEVHFDIGRG